MSMKTRGTIPDPNEKLVRTQDPDRFLISIFFPPEIRSHLCALYAFNHEIARTREVVTDTHIGLIRLQWWRDALAAFYERNEVAKHDVVEGLSKAIWRYDLRRELFDHLIYAREFDLEDRAPGSLEGLCNYADFTHTPLLRMGVIAAGEDPDHPAVQPVAMAYALTGLIRAMPFLLQQNRHVLPDDLVRRYSIDMDAIRAGRDLTSVTPAVRDIRDKAKDLLRQGGGVASGRMIRLHKVVTEQYINKISLLEDNPFDPRIQVPPLFREFRLWLAAGKAQ